MEELLKFKNEIIKLRDKKGNLWLETVTYSTVIKLLENRIAKLKEEGDYNE